jgi:hypothetical protein
MLAGMLMARPAPWRGVDRRGHLAAGFGLARRDHHLRAMFGQPLGDGPADAARRAGDMATWPSSEKRFMAIPCVAPGCAAGSIC